ncbi:putative hemolysin [Klebsiella aerogenes]|uniref:putative hemolysin n=1 Tax=Klebsiella aerogenes TaxID=548 RepID=UPI003D04F10C
MKKTFLVMMAVLVSGCSAKPDDSYDIGMADPASIHCIRMGGKIDIVKEDAGDVGYCTLPSGERKEEWAMYRQDLKTMSSSMNN